MDERARRGCFTRRGLLAVTVGAGAAVLSPPIAHAGDEAAELIKTLFGKTPIESDKVRLSMPASFPNGYTVPLNFAIDSPMTASDHVRQVHVLAPQNPIVEVAAFSFAPGRSEPRISTRIRLAMSQDVLAVAEMSDGSMLMAKTWVKVASNGCA